MEPVNIDFVIGGNVDSEGKKVEQQFDRISDSVGESRAELQESVRIQKKVIKELEAELKALEKAYEKAAPGTAKFQASQKLTDVKTELAGEKAALQELDTELAKSADSHQRLRTQIRKVTEAMASMEAAGKRNTPEFVALRNEAGRLTDALGDAQTQAKVLAHDNGGLQGVISGVAGLSGAMSAGMGVVGLFGAENEKLAKIQTKLQSLMAITIGLQQLANTLNKDSYFRIVTVNKAKQAWAKSTALLNTQLGISVGLSKALMVGGIGILLAGIAAAVVAYQKWNTKQEEANKLQKEFIDLEKDTAKAMAKEKVEVEQLMSVAADQSKDLDTRNKAIKRLNELMPDYNGHLNREGELVANTETALKNYLTTLYKVEKAKKLIANIEDKDAEIAGMEAKPAEKVGWLKKGLARMAAAQDETGNLNADDMINSMNEELAKKREAAIQLVRDEKISMEAELKKLLGDSSVFDALFGNGKKSKESQSSTSKIDLDGVNAGYADQAIIDQLQHQISLTDDENKKLALRNQIRDKELEITKQQIEAEKQRVLAEAKENGATESRQQTIVTTYETKKQNEEKATEQEKKQDAETVENANEKRKNENLLRQLSNYEAYAQKVVEIEQWKAEQIAAIDGNKAMTQDEKTEKKKKTETIAQLDTGSAAAEYGVDPATISGDVMSVVHEVVTMSFEEIAAQLPVLEAELAKLRKDPQAGKKVAVLAAKVAVYRKQVNKTADSLNDVSGEKVQDTSKKFSDATKVLNGVQGVIGEIQDAFGDMLSDVGNDAMSVVQTTVSATIGVIGAMQSTAVAAGSSISAVEKASVILTIISAAISVVMALVNLLSRYSSTAKLQEQIDGYIEKVNELEVEIDKLDVKLKQVFGQEYYNTLGEQIDIQKKKLAELDKAITASKKKEEELNKKQARGYQATAAILEQLTLGAAGLGAAYSDSEAAYEAAMEKANKTKNKKEKKAAEQTAELEKQRMEEYSALLDMQNELFEELATTNLKDFAGSMADAMVEGFSNGSAGITQAFDDTIDDLKKSMLKKQLAIALETQFESAFDYLKEAATGDSKLTQDEIDRFTALMESGQAGAEALAEQYRQVYEQMGWLDDADSESGIQGDVSNMSEETATALVGQLTAMRLHVAALLANSTSSIDTAGEQLAELRRISENTAYCRRLDRIDETLVYLKNNGIKMR